MCTTNSVLINLEMTEEAAYILLPKIMFGDLRALAITKVEIVRPGNNVNAKETDARVNGLNKALLTKKLKVAASLHKFVAKHFNQTELRELCIDLGVEYESLEGQGRIDKARELVAYLDRRGHTDQLISKCFELRPKVAVLYFM